MRKAAEAFDDVAMLPGVAQLPGIAEIGEQQDAAVLVVQLLAFCRSGTRSALAVALAKRDEGASSDEVIQKLNEAGFDHGPIAHLL